MTKPAGLLEQLLNPETALRHYRQVCQAKGNQCLTRPQYEHERTTLSNRDGAQLLTAEQIEEVLGYWPGISEELSDIIRQAPRIEQRTEAFASPWLRDLGGGKYPEIR